MRLLTATLALLLGPAAAALAQLPRETQLDKARNTYFEAMQKMQAAYRKSFAETLAAFTKVEVYLLDFEMTDVEEVDRFGHWFNSLPEDQFPIVPYGRQAKVLQRKMLTADEVKLFLPSLQETVAVEDSSGGALCHYPIYGVRVWGPQDQVVFQTSICLMCGNFYMTYPFETTAHWTSLGRSSIDQILERLLPIPQKEKDRFAKKGVGKGK